MRPTAAQAADYSATPQWLQAVQTAGTTDADAVVRVLDCNRFEDPFVRHAEWRAADHMVVHDLCIAQVLPAAGLAGPRLAPCAGDGPGDSGVPAERGVPPGTMTPPPS